jgi:RNA polymerase sigma-70 factor (ECF subfamily)
VLLLRLRRRTPDPDLAAEALQDTFVAVWKSAKTFRGEGDVGA